jgi:hypothetical protein
MTIVDGHSYLYSGKTEELLTSTSSVCNAINFLSVTNLNNRPAVIAVYYTDTTATWNDSSNKVYLYRFVVEESSTKLFSSVDFPANGFLGGHATERKLYIKLETNFDGAHTHISFQREDGSPTDMITVCLPPVAFAASTSYRYYMDIIGDGGEANVSSSSAYYIAQFMIPSGATLKEVEIDSTSNDAFEVFEGRRNSNATVSLGTGTSNTTPLTGLSFVSDGCKYISIVFDPNSSTDGIYGAAYKYVP